MVGRDAMAASKSNISEKVAIARVAMDVKYPVTLKTTKGLNLNLTAAEVKSPNNKFRVGIAKDKKTRSSFSSCRRHTNLQKEKSHETGRLQNQ